MKDTFTTESLQNFDVKWIVESKSDQSLKQNMALMKTTHD